MKSKLESPTTVETINVKPDNPQKEGSIDSDEDSQI